MFDWKKTETTTKVVEETKVEKKQEEREEIYYSLGPTTKGRVMLTVRYSSITMNEAGINTLIAALESSKVWLTDGNEPEEACQEEETPV